MKCKSCGKEKEEFYGKHCIDCARLIIKEMSRTDEAVLTLKHPVLIKLCNAAMYLWGLSFISGIVFTLYWIFGDIGMNKGVAPLIIWGLLFGPMLLVSLIGQIQFEKDLS